MSLPDNEQVMSEVKSLANEARANAARQAPQPSAPIVGLIAPIHMGAALSIPERYVVHFTITRCKNCNTESRYNEFFSLHYLRSRINGTRVRHLIRCDRPEYDLPVDRIPVGTRGVPFCCECASIDLSHLPPPPDSSRLMDLPDPVSKGRHHAAGGKRQPGKTSVKPATLDDLI